MQLAKQVDPLGIRTIGEFQPAAIFLSTDPDICHRCAYEA